MAVTGTARGTVDHEFDATADERLSSSIDPVQQGDEALGFHLAQGLLDGPAEHLATDQAVIGLIRQLEMMLGTAQDRHEAGCLPEQLA